MDLIAEFLRHAEECERMARFTRDAESKAMWSRMAQRWLGIANKLKAESGRRDEARASAGGRRRRHSPPRRSRAA